MNNTAKTELFESLWSRSPETLAVEITLGIAICSSSIFGNMLVRFAVYREKKLLTTSNCLVVSMAASDFLIAFLCEPLSFAVIAGIQNNWTLGRFMCQFQGMLTMLLTTSSVFNVTLVAINRYLLVVRPTFYRAYFSQRLAYGAILMVWILSAVSGVTYLASGKVPISSWKTVLLNKIWVAFRDLLANTWCSLPSHYGALLCSCLPEHKKI